MAAPTPPRTPTAKKSLPSSPAATTQIVTNRGSPLSIQKRKWQGNTASLQRSSTQPESVSEGAPSAQTMSGKRQKIGAESKSEQQVQDLTISASPLPNQTLVQVPSGSPSGPPQVRLPSRQNPPNDWPQKIFLAALKGSPALVSGNPLHSPVNSQRIDNVTHAMWQVVFNHEDMMKDITAKASMFSQLKLRTLARLNYLPSWWYLREMACSLMDRQGWLVDDRDMQSFWKETVEWCSRVEIKLGVQGGDKIGAPKGEGGNKV